MECLPTLPPDAAAASALLVPSSLAPPLPPRRTPSRCGPTRRPRRRWPARRRQVRLESSEPVEVAFGAVRVFDVDGVFAYGDARYLGRDPPTRTEPLAWSPR
ncbi:MAG: hypothetical protein LC792_12330 [Actinobacteria bacterium]|nr:hypothetical protein [Actinomycetota bacterium]